MRKEKERNPIPSLKTIPRSGQHQKLETRRRWNSRITPFIGVAKTLVENVRSGVHTSPRNARHDGIHRWKREEEVRRQDR
jgi:hypothetical protein